MKAESLAWPMKVIKELVTEDELVDELLVWLGKWDVEYSKFIDPKLQLLIALEDYKSPKIRPAVEKFLNDVNEPARFHAVVTTVAQGEADAVVPLLDCLLDEESVRVKNKIVDGFIAQGWAVPEEKRDEVRKSLPSGTTIDAVGALKRRA
jgi:hypothetical protein